MERTCATCGTTYDDAVELTDCPHTAFISLDDALRKDVAMQILGERVRLTGSLDDGREHVVTSVNFHGYVTLGGDNRPVDPAILRLVPHA